MCYVTKRNYNINLHAVCLIHLLMCLLAKILTLFHYSNKILALKDDFINQWSMLEINNIYLLVILVDKVNLGVS